jgi:hypothetical protein
MIKDHEKVICVPVDPIWNSLNDLSDMNPHLLKKLSIFPSIQDLENKTVDVGGWGDVNEAYEIIKNVQIVLIKLKINQKDYLVLNNITLIFIKKSNIL